MKKEDMCNTKQAEVGLNQPEKIFFYIDAVLV